MGEENDVKSLEEKQETTIIIDWLEFTIQSDDFKFDDVIIELLGFDVNSFTLLDKGKMGYKKQMFYNNICVLYEGNSNMGIHVIMSGQACRFYESIHSLQTLITNLNIIDATDSNKPKKDVKTYARITRIDLAMDDKTGKVIKFDRLIKDITNANIVSKWKTNTQIIKRSNNNGKIIGETISLGNRSSNVFLRIYDKKLEQETKAIDKQVKEIKDVKVWYRMELELKKESARIVQKKIFEVEIGELFSSILNNYMRIVIPNPDDTNKSRWQVQNYWKNIIKTTAKLSLSTKPESKTLDDKRNWLIKQVAPSLAMVLLKDGNYQFMIEETEKGKKRLKEKHFKIIKDSIEKEKDYIKKQGENKNE